MLTRTERFFRKAKQFQDERAKLTDEFEKKIQGLHKYKGSAGYTKDVEKAENEYKKTLEELKINYQDDFYSILKGMTEAVNVRTIEAPTQEMLNLLSALKMQKVSRDMLDRAAVAMNGNPVAIGVIQDIAKEAGIAGNYFNHYCHEMSNEKAYDVIKALGKGVTDFLNSDSKRTSRVAEQFYQRHYGEGISPKRRELFDNEEDCFFECC